MFIPCDGLARAVFVQARYLKIPVIWSGAKLPSGEQARVVARLKGDQILTLHKSFVMSHKRELVPVAAWGRDKFV